MKLIILLPAAALLMGSCGIYSKYEPETQVPDGLFGSDVPVASDTSHTLGRMEWRQVFTDTCLQELIDSALVRNTDLRTAHLRVGEAEAALLTAKLSYLPSLFFTPEGAVSSVDRSKAAQTYSVPVSASWELDVFGRNTNNMRGKRAALGQAEAYSQAVRTQLVAAVANTYYTLLMLDAQYAIADSTEGVWREMVEATRALRKASMVTEAQLGQTEATYYSVRTTLLDLKEQVNQAENAMNLLLARVPQHIRRGNLYSQRLPETFEVGIPLQMLSDRPDVHVAELALAQAFYATNTARSSFYPSITLGGSAGWTNSAGGFISNPAIFVASAVASLTQPLFNRGALVAQLKIAKAQQEEAQLAFGQTLLQAGTEVNEALDSYQTARAKAGLYEQQVDALERAERSTRLLMQNSSTTTYLEVLTARQTLLQARLTQVANRFAEMRGFVTLYKALGGGRM